MGCGFCEKTFSGLIGGLVSLVTFIVFPILQMLWATVMIIFEKLGLKGSQQSKKNV